LAQKHAQLTLRNEMRNFKRVAGLMPLDRLTLLAEPELALDPDAEERAMLVRAALLHQIDPGVWLQRQEHSQEVLPTLLTMLLDTALEATIRRRILGILAPMTLESRALEAVAAVTQDLGNPTWLAQLPPLSPPIRALFEQATWERFFAAMVEVSSGGCYLGSSQEGKAQRKARLRPDLHARIDTEMDYHWQEVPGFFMDPTAVSNEQYAEFSPMHRHFFAANEGRLPAVNVSYEEATAYAHWLGKRLPSEVEWEKAARGTAGQLFPWGNHFEGHRVNSAESGRRSPVPVDALPEGGSPYGCLNMAGNVWEWTSTPWLPGSPLMAKKGGCALNYEPHMHCSARFEDPPEMRLRWAGFRLVSDERKASWC
jgi:formylglycine-generating enzyme required for sulfatase activity